QGELLAPSALPATLHGHRRLTAGDQACWRLEPPGRADELPGDLARLALDLAAQEAGAEAELLRRRNRRVGDQRVVADDAVGHAAMTSSGSPITSESASVTTVAGHAARARSPPLKRERCLRTALSSAIVAPAARRRRVTCCFSSSMTGGAGAAASADPPPETRKTTRSSSRALAASSRSRADAARPRASGTGWPASA